ncbi:MAG: hypothetical protein WA003_08610 [Desulfuromonadaceae bacterium]
MTPETRKKLEQKLNEHGLSVLLTRDYDSILLQLASLAQFKRLMLTNAPPFCAADISAICRSSDIETDRDMRPMEILDIPVIGMELNRALQDQLDKRACISLHRVNAAVLAFVGILCAEGR